MVDAEMPTVLAISAPHCPHCKAISPLLEAASARHGDSIRYVEVSAPDVPNLVAELGVRGTPSLLAFRDGVEVTRHVGAGSTHDVERVFQAAGGASTRARSISTTDRGLRTAIGAALVTVGLLSGVLWMAALGGAFLVGGWYDLLPGARRGDSRTVDAAGAAKRMEQEDVIVIDVRTAAEISDGAIPGAIHIDIAGGGFVERMAKLDSSQQYLLYCRTGARSARALRMFRNAGIDRSVHLAGGIRAWARAGLPIASDPGNA